MAKLRKLPRRFDDDNGGGSYIANAAAGQANAAQAALAAVSGPSTASAVAGGAGGYASDPYGMGTSSGGYATSPQEPVSRALTQPDSGAGGAPKDIVPFGEEDAMDRKEMLDTLAKLGYDTTKITDAVPDDAIAEILRVYENKDSSDAAEAKPADPAAPQQPKQFDDAPPEPTGDEPMSHEELVKALVDMGYDQADLDSKSDEELQQLLESETDAASQGGDQPEHFDDEVPADPAAPPVEEHQAAPTRDEMVDALTEVGHDRSQLEAMSDEELADLFNQELESTVKQMAEEDELVRQEQSAMEKQEPAPQDAARVGKMSERAPSVAEFQEALLPVIRQVVGEALASHKQELETLRRTTGQLARNNKRANVLAFCESMRTEGRILPSKFDEVVARLMRADASKVVHRFSESGKTLTELDIQMSEIKKSAPLVSFTEKFSQPVKKLDTEVGKIKNHYDQFSEKYKKCGTTKEAMVKAYKSKRAKANGRLTAESFLSYDR